jgi:4-carboxymuconolactone decarboxylase
LQSPRGLQQWFVTLRVSFTHAKHDPAIRTQAIAKTMTMLVTALITTTPAKRVARVEPKAQDRFSNDLSKPIPGTWVKTHSSARIAHGKRKENTMRMKLLFVLVAGFVVGAHGQTPAPPDPAKIQLRGDRLKPLTYDQMTPEQKALTERMVTGKIQGGTTGPYNALLRSPELAETVMRYGENVRFHSSLPNRLNEIAALLTTRYWSAQFPWYAHHRAGTQAGLSDAFIAAIAEGRRPAAMQADEEAVYNLCSEMLSTRQLSDATFKAAVDKLGERAVVDVLGVMGYYTIVSLAVNADRYPLPDGVKPELKPLQ